MVGPKCSYRDQALEAFLILLSALRLADTGFMEAGLMQ